MSTVTDLFDLATGKPLSAERESTPHRLQLVVHATLASVVFAALYGLAAGSSDLGLAIGNIYKVPMVILLSTLCALPVGLLTWKLSGAKTRGSDLLVGVAAGNFTATLVLASLAPIVALYYHSSGFMGGALALGAGALAVGLGLFNLVRAVANRIPDEASRALAALPVVALIFAQLVSLVQFIHVASPILPEITVFDGGVDAILGSFEMLAALLLCAPLAGAAVTAVAHDGVAQGEGISWTTTVVADSAGEVSFAVPLPPGAVVVGAETVVTDGRITGVVLPRLGRTTLHVQQPRQDSLSPPLFPAPAVERVTLKGVRYTPDAALGFEEHVGYTLQPGVDRGERAALRAQLGIDGPHPLYFVADEGVVRAGGLAGEVRSGDATDASTSVAVAGVFGAVLLALAVATRLLARQARRYDREAYLREELVGKP